MTTFAPHIWVGPCINPKCRALHIDLISEEGNTIACSALDIDDVEAFAESLKKHAHEIRIKKRRTLASPLHIVNGDDS